MSYNKYIGFSFGRLTVISIKEIKNQNGSVKKIATCQCECGNYFESSLNKLKKGDRKSCGCYFHKKAGTKTARSWNAMKTRCLNPNADNYSRYGGIGKKICKGCMEFRVFYKIVGEAPSPKHSIDRIKNELHYSCGECDECELKNWPMNLRWATNREQSLNSRQANMITHNGVTMCLKDWAKERNMSRLTLSARINIYKWSIEKSLNEPVKKNKR